MARTASKIAKSIPNSDKIKMVCFTKPNESGDKYIVTQNPLKEQFTLWKCLDDNEEFERVKTSNSPLDFDEIIPYEM